MTAVRYCPLCGGQVLLVDVAVVHRGTGKTECTPSRFTDPGFTEQVEQDVLAAAIDLVRWFQSSNQSLPAHIPRVFVNMLDRADALLEAYDPASLGTTGGTSPWT